jgi:hypothetical protein
MCWLEGLGLATLVSGGVTVVCCCGRGHPEMKQELYSNLMMAS